MSNDIKGIRIRILSSDALNYVVDQISSIRSGLLYAKVLFVIVSLALYCCDSYYTNDIVCGASTGQVVYRFSDTLSYRSVSFCFCKTLNKIGRAHV